MNVYIKAGALRTAAHTVMTWPSLAVQVWYYMSVYLVYTHVCVSYTIRSDGSAAKITLTNR